MSYTMFPEFQTVNTPTELKGIYRKLALKFHPDNQETGCEEKFKLLGEFYHHLLAGKDGAKFKNHATNEEYEYSYNKDKTTKETSEFTAVITSILSAQISDLKIELVGSWLWIYGTVNAQQAKILESSGCQYSTKHKCYMYTGSKLRKDKRSGYSSEKIKNKYGCQNIDPQSFANAYDKISAKACA